MIYKQSTIPEQALSFWKDNKYRRYINGSLRHILLPGIYDENLNRLYLKEHRVVGSGSYSSIIFRCSKCSKLYSTLGSLRFYHKCKSKEYKLL